MNNTLQQKDKKLSIGGILCIVAALAIIVTNVIGAVNAVTQCVQYVSEMQKNVDLSSIVLNSPDSVRLMSYISNITSSASTAIINITLILGAIAFATMGVFIILQKRMRNIAIFPLIEIALAVFPIFVIIASPIIRVIIGLFIYPSGALTNGLSGLFNLPAIVPYLLMAASWAALTAIIIVFALRRNVPNKAVTIILSIASALTFGVSYASKFVSSAITFGGTCLMWLFSGYFTQAPATVVEQFFKTNLTNLASSALSSSIFSILVGASIFFVVYELTSKPSENPQITE